MSNAADVAELVVARLIEIGAVTPRPAAILTLKEALAVAKKNSEDAFYRWDAKFGPTSCGHGRYSRARIERALEKEARK